MSDGTFTHVIAVGLGDEDVAAFRRQAERVAAGLLTESVRSLDTVEDLVLFDSGCALLMPLAGRPLSP